MRDEPMNAPNMDATQKVEATKQHQNETEIGYVEKPN
jgi:hypothetical protein